MHRSRSASSSSVRCGCQYYQNNDPLPEKKSLIGTPPRSRTPTMTEHEYEPITPKEPPPPPILKVSEFTEIEKRPSTPVQSKDYKRRFIKIPNEDAIIIPLHGDSDEEINPDRYVNKDLTIQEFQDKIEERFFTTDSNADFSGRHVENQIESQAKFQTKLRNQAGRIKKQLRKISKPNISLPDRSKLKLPERPKIKLPERPKIKLPDKPKFLREKPKFLTERPKFLTERPKFHFPNRPKFHLPERFKSEKTKHKSVKSKKPNSSSLRRPLRDVVTVSSQSGSTGNIFNTFKFKTYPRFLGRKKKEKKESQLSAFGTSFETESSLPSTPPNQKKFNPPWIETYRDIKFADDDTGILDQSKDSKMEIPDEEGYDENTGSFHDSYLPGTVNLQEEPIKAKPESEGSVNDSDKEIQSSGSSSMRHRAGVLEEIDSDEFFLREKGLSREDVDVSRYLSLEIRDAFRSPKNALAKLDAELYDDEYEEDGPEIRLAEIPIAPERRKHSTKSAHSKRTAKESDFHTFPLRPNRRKQSDPTNFSDEFEKIEKPPRKYRSKSDTRQGSMPSLRRSTSQEIVVDTEPPLPPKRRKGSRSLSRSIHEITADVDAADIVQAEVTAQGREVPVVPLRKSRSRGTSLAEEDRTSRGADSTDLPHDDVELQIEIEKETVEESILLGKPSYEQESNLSGYAVVMKTRKDKAKPPPRPPPPPARQKKHKFQSHLHNIKDQSVNFFFTYPRRAIKSLHKPPPVRPIRNYSTLGPSRPPRRTRVFREPVYVDSEEPHQVLATELINNDDDVIDVKEDFDLKDLQSGEIVEKMKGRPLPPPPRPPRRIKDEDTLLKSSQLDDDNSNIISSEAIEEKLIEELKQMSLEGSPKGNKEEVKEKSSYIKSKREEFFNSLSKMYPFSTDRRKSDTKKEEKSSSEMTRADTCQQTSFEVTEVSVSIQTDPLPEGYIVEDVHSELETETSSQRSQSTAADQTRLEPRQQIPGSEKGLERESISTSVQEKHLCSEDNELSAIFPNRDEPPSYESREESPPPLPRRGIPSIYPTSLPVVPVFPEKLHISELDVDKLNVSELQASKVSTHEIESTSINVAQLNSKGGNLVINGIELPTDFIQSLAAQIQERFPEQTTFSQPAQQLPQPQPQPQLRKVMTPPPSIFVQHSEEAMEKPVPMTTQTTDKIPKPKTTRSKGRRSPTRILDDSEDELASILPVRERRERESSVNREISRQSQESPRPDTPPVSLIPIITPTAMQLIGQLLVIWHRNIIDGANSFMEGVNALFPEGEKRRDAQTAACILLVLIAGLILIGFGIDNSVHHHHWDFFPPR